jgi:transcriptional regulator with XRE-family HTH domain
MADPKCPVCDGTGIAPIALTAGDKLRAIRVAAGLSMSEVASRMDISTPYLCDLELGKRDWSLTLAMKFRKACAK